MGKVGFNTRAQLRGCWLGAGYRVAGRQGQVAGRRVRHASCPASCPASSPASCPAVPWSVGLACGVVQQGETACWVGGCGCGGPLAVTGTGPTCSWRGFRGLVPAYSRLVLGWHSSVGSRDRAPFRCLQRSCLSSGPRLVAWRPPPPHRHQHAQQCGGVLPRRRPHTGTQRLARTNPANSSPCYVATPTHSCPFPSHRPAFSSPWPQCTGTSCRACPSPPSWCTCGAWCPAQWTRRGTPPPSGPSSSYASSPS